MRIWIDIDNAPHVHIMAPIIEELKKNGHNILITARDYGQTIELLKMKNISHKLIGRHPGGNFTLKILFLIFRMFYLFWWAIDKKIDLALSHGSRSLVLPARFLGIPVITMYDYEYVSDCLFKKFSKAILMPAISYNKDNKKYLPFPGLKEEIYLWDHKYNPDWSKGIKVEKDKVLAVLRPPASMAHYHNINAEKTFESILKDISKKVDVEALVVPRTKRQEKEMIDSFQGLDGIIILEKAVDGISMLKGADLVIGGGGTMNREAALLGTPVYSIFQGKTGKIDKWLSEKGKLKFINSPQETVKINYKKTKRKEPLTNVLNLKNIVCGLIEKVYRN
jgi:predicted glycosyltransferase